MDRLSSAKRKQVGSIPSTSLFRGGVMVAHLTLAQVVRVRILSLKIVQGVYPSGQRKLTVNQMAAAFVSSNLTAPIFQVSSAVERWPVKSLVAGSIPALGVYYNQCNMSLESILTLDYYNGCMFDLYDKGFLFAIFSL